MGKTTFFSDVWVSVNIVNFDVFLCNPRGDYTASYGARAASDSV